MAVVIKNQESEGLGQEDLTRLKNLLLQRREEIFRQVQNLQSGMREVSQEPQPEVVEKGQEQEFIETYEPIDEQELAEVREIDAAINRIADGTYGICENCGARIPAKRLYALPWTRLCLECSEERDRESQLNA